ncbi:MAG: hypothetical protein R6X02_26545 [Enhygromyxa sp.]
MVAGVAFAVMLLGSTAALAQSPDPLPSPSPSVEPEIPITPVIPPDATEVETLPGHDKSTMVKYKLPDGSRVEVLTTSSGRRETTTFDANGVRREIETIDQFPKRNLTNTVTYKFSRVRYDEKGRRIESVTSTDTWKLSQGWGRIREESEGRRRTFDETGKVVVDLNEKMTVIAGDGPPVVTGKRTIIRTAPDGSKEEHHEIWNDRQGWTPAPSQPAPSQPGSDEPAPSEPASGEPASQTSSSGPWGYVAIAPGLIHIPIEAPDQVGYQWGLRGGVELGCGPSGPACFAVAVGGSFQHSVGKPYRSAEISSSSHQLRVQAEAMPGVRLLDGRLFVFGDVGLGYVAQPSRVELYGDVTRDTRHGVAFSVGAGSSYVVWRQLFVGGRFGGDMQWMFASGDSFGAHNLALEAFAGWRF